MISLSLLLVYTILGKDKLIRNTVRGDTNRGGEMIRNTVRGDTNRGGGTFGMSFKFVLYLVQ